MKTALQGVRMVALCVWVGGLVFFAFVVAPVAFGALPTAHEAGLVVGGCLRVLHGMGLVAGAVFCCATLLLRGTSRRRVTEVAAAGLMLGITAVSQFGVLPRMERDRIAAGGVIRTVGEGDSVRAEASRDFDRLHAWSEKMEGAVLLLGLAVLVSASTDPGAAGSGVTGDERHQRTGVAALTER